MNTNNSDLIIMFVFIVIGIIFITITNSVFNDIYDKCGGSNTLINSLLVLQIMGVVFITVGVLQLICRMLVCGSKKPLFSINSKMPILIMMGLISFVCIVTSSICINEINKYKEMCDVGSGGVITLLILSLFTLIGISVDYGLNLKGYKFDYKFGKIVKK